MVKILIILSIILLNAFVASTLICIAFWRTQKDLLRALNKIVTLQPEDLYISPDDEQLARYAIKHRKSIAEQINLAYSLGFRDAKDKFRDTLNL